MCFLKDWQKVTHWENETVRVNRFDLNSDWRSD
jgi:hypothetical protein